MGAYCLQVSAWCLLFVGVLLVLQGSAGVGGAAGALQFNSTAMNALLLQLLLTLWVGGLGDCV